MITKIVIFCYLLAICQLCDINPNKKVLVIDEPILMKKTLNG
jgi:hypothetical protein